MVGVNNSYAKIRGKAHRDLKAKGHSREEIADILRKHVNTLYENIKQRKARKISNEKKATAKK
ncbi:MAG: hypothetical protein BWX74_00530 [Tenericutes bacterium ADurb.Bin087]|nr:MAG: hypothetical protein BWX74_00530 [Tenericutes bacterium ADurb.Bin087]